MSWKQPIDPKDIKAGDHIRFEFAKPTPGGSTAHEYRATTGEHTYNAHLPGQHYLLERPKTLLYPAGTDLWLTENFLPWKAGDRITLAEDWYEGDARGGAAYMRPPGLTVPLDRVTDKRPEPDVDVPIVFTHGFLSWTNSVGVSHRVFAAWCSDGRKVESHLGHGISCHSVTAFTPAIAVPTEALDLLRERYDPEIASPAHNFFDAIDGVEA